MTDITKYKNVTLTKETYSNIQTLSKEVFDIPISLSKTIQYLAEKEIEAKNKWEDQQIVLNRTWVKLNYRTTKIHQRNDFL